MSEEGKHLERTINGRQLVECTESPFVWWKWGHYFSSKSLRRKKVKQNTERSIKRAEENDRLVWIEI
jgi:hypothetical protein